LLRKEQIVNKSKNTGVRLVMKELAPLPADGDELEATLTDIEGLREPLELNGRPCVRLHFEITDPDHAGRTATALTSASLKTQSRLHSLLRGLLGRDPKHQEDVTDEVMACIQNAYRITVAHQPAREGDMVFLNVTEIGPLVDLK
jgi:hypothetical protein